MKKLLILAVTALLALTACDKTTRTIGNGEIVCNPSTMTVKVGETKSFTFTCTSGRQFPEDNPLIWKTFNLDDDSKGDILFEYEGENTISVCGRVPGTVTLCAAVKESEHSELVLGAVEITVQRKQ